MSFSGYIKRVKIRPLKIFTDFDGTITKIDTLQMVLDKFARGDWRLIEDMVSRKEIPEKIGLQKEFDLVHASKLIVLNYLKNNVMIDNSFADFAKWCQMEKISLVVLSGGFDEFIRVVFNKYEINYNLKVYANSVEVKNSRWRINPPDLPRIKNLCNLCKTNHILTAKNAGNLVVYIGEGNTDRCPAEHADYVFAKGDLAVYLEPKRIKYFPYDNFSDIHTFLLNKNLNR